MNYKICFVSQNIYPLLKESKEFKFVGGAEVQQLLLGQELAKKKNEVSFITLDQGQEPIEKIGCFTVISTFKPDEGIPVLRFFYPRLYKIWKALYKANADIYYVRCAGFILGICALFAKLHHKKIVYNGASNNDFSRNKNRIPTFRDQMLFEWGLKKTDLVIVQNRVQKDSLMKNYNIHGHVIYNGFPKFENHEKNTKDRILWVGTDKAIKRPELFLELVKKFPDEKFVMVGGISSANTPLIERAKELTNLFLTGLIPFNETERYFKNSKLLVNTSEYEGFPNTYLQAWRRGIPVITFFDPDSLIQNNQLGVLVKSLEEMMDKIKGILENKILFSADHIQTFFKNYLSLETMTQKFDTMFTSLISSERIQIGKPSLVNKELIPLKPQ